MNLSYVFDHGDAVLIATFLLLTAMSLVSWYVIFWKAWSLRRERASLTAFQANKTTEGAAQRLVKTSEHCEKEAGTLEMHLAQALDHIRVSLDRGLTILASVGTSAPFIGLFGTVWGVYNALTRIAAEGNASLNVVAGPMGEALIATAVGLFAAIPAVLAYNAFVRVNRVLVQDLRHIAEKMVAASEAPAVSTPEPIRLAAGGQ